MYDGSYGPSKSVSQKLQDTQVLKGKHEFFRVETTLLLYKWLCLMLRLKKVVNVFCFIFPNIASAGEFKDGHLLNVKSQTFILGVAG